MAGAGGTLKTLNLSGTGISGQLPRLDILLPKLVTLDVSNSKMTGYVNKLPDTLITCGTSGTGMCYYKESSWAGITPASCIATLPQCAGTAPSAAAPPYPDPIRPHWTDISNYEAAGLKSIEGQCDALRAWLVAHEYDEAALWKAGTKCCNWGSISCYNSWAITSIYFGGTGLRGNINEPANTLSELKALQGIDLGYNKLSGAFPTFLLGMPDLSTIDLSYNQLTGSVVDLLPLERLRSLEFQGNQLTGSIPLLVSRNSSYGCGCSTCGCGSSYLYTCKIEGAPNDKLCWKYDPIFYGELSFEYLTLKSRYTDTNSLFLFRCQLRHVKPVDPTMRQHRRRARLFQARRIHLGFQLELCSFLPRLWPLRQSPHPQLRSGPRSVPRPQHNCLLMVPRRQVL